MKLSLITPLVFFSLLPLACSDAVPVGGDGSQPAAVVDGDGDGVPDALGRLVDANGDGVADEVPGFDGGIALDTNGDGVTDAVGYDRDSDGRVDEVDRNLDGVIDEVVDWAPAPPTPRGDGDAPANDGDAPASDGGTTGGNGDTPGGDGDATVGGSNLGTPPLAEGPTTDALETVGEKFWVSYDGGTPGSLDWSLADDGSGSNLIVQAAANGEQEGSVSVSLSIPQAELTDEIAQSTGVRFNIGGSGTVLFQAQSGAVIPTDAGGWCEAEQCWNAHEESIQLTESYQAIELAWDEMVQPWGTEHNPTALYPEEILLLSWIIPKQSEGNFFLDSIELIADDGSGPSSGVGLLISQAEFNAIVGNSTAYTYPNFLTAADSFIAFAGGTDATWAKREIAMFLANAKWETGSFQYTEEIDPGTYCDGGRSYGCPAGVSAYYGRGSMQLSWNYNYKAAGDYLGADLLSSPGLVTSDGILLWKTGLWFWMNPGYTASPHALFKQGFGATIRAINGALECDGKRPDAISGRLAHYQNALAILGVSADGTDGGC